MDLELLTIGTELLLGFTIDTNAAELARALATVGARVVRRATVRDDAAEIEAAVGDALARTGCVITTGGLGPTRDDITKKSVAHLFDAPLELDAAYLARLSERFARLGHGAMPTSNRSQAEVPRGAIVLTNRRGTAPGLWLEGSRGIAIMLPGVPREMLGLLHEEVLPRVRKRVLQAKGRPRVTRSRTMRTTGISESALADVIGPLDEGLAPVTLAYLPSVEGVDLRLTVWSAEPTEAERLLTRAADTLTPTLGTYCYGEDNCDLAALVLERLAGRGGTLAVAESCTGGVVGARLSGIPGASRVFLGGVVAYADRVKVVELGVSQDLFTLHGAVSEPVARAMVEGVAERLGATASVAVTGIAGPTGGTPDKPIGTVWLAAHLGSVTETAMRRFPGGREDVRQRSAQAALDLLRRLLDGGQ
jgi:nicotinamide-nucleotide amidase